MITFFEKLTEKFSSSKILMLIDGIIAISLFAAVNILYWFINMSDILPLWPKVLNLATLLLCLPVIRHAFGIYSSVWRYAQTYSYLKLIAADLYVGIVYIFIIRFVGTISFNIWISISLILMIDLTTLLSRFIYQQLHTKEHYKESSKDAKKNAVIVGAGREGVMLANALLYNPKAKYIPYCFVDINKDKVGKKISGIKIIEADDYILDKLRHMPVEVIIIAISKLNEVDTKRLYDFYK